MAHWAKEQILYRKGGGSPYPSALKKRQCATCGVMAFDFELVLETNVESPSFNRMVHPDCYDGPIPEQEAIVPEDTQRR